MADLIEELQGMLGSDPRTARLQTILGLALDEAERLALRERGHSKPL